MLASIQAVSWHGCSEVSEDVEAAKSFVEREVRMTSTGMFKVLRKRVTFAERDMDVVYGSRGLKVKRSICRIVNKNMFL